MYQNKEFTFKFYLAAEESRGVEQELLTIKHCRAEVRITNYSYFNSGMISINIFGVSLDTIATITQRTLSYFDRFTNLNGNSLVQIFYGGDVIAQGTLLSAYAELNQAPDSSIMLTASSTAGAKAIAVKPFTYNGVISLKDCVNAIAQTINYTTEFYGVDGLTLQNPYLTGDAITQMQMACMQCSAAFSLGFGKVIVMKSGLDREPIELSPQNGLIGYPVVQGNGIVIKAIYSPLFSIGAKVSLTTSLPHASGEYVIWSVESTIYARTKGAVPQTLMLLMRGA